MRAKAQTDAKQKPSSELKEELAQFDRYMSVINELYYKIPKREFDPSVLALEFNGDLKKAFEFVRDEVAFESYRGSLRGAKGTLMGRAGNSLDRAILLAKLIEPSGLKVRYAYGRLDDIQAQQLADRMFLSMPPLPVAIMEDEQNKEIAALCLELGIEPNEIEPNILQMRNKMKQFREEFVTDLANSEKLLRKILGNKLKSVGTSQNVQMKEILEEVKTHYWLQVEIGESWIDLDPFTPYAKRGNRLCQKIDGYFEEVPNRLKHRLRIVLVLQPGLIKKSNGSITGVELIEENILDYEVKIPNHVGEGINLSIVPVGLSIKDLLDKSLTHDAMLKRISEFQPFLSLGESEAYGGRPFNVKGHIFTVKAGQIGAPMERLWKTVPKQIQKGIDIFDDESQSGGERIERLMGMRIEYYLYQPPSIPGGQNDEESFVRNLINPKRILKWSPERLENEWVVRTEKQLKLLALSKTDILINVCRVSDYFAAEERLRSTLAKKDLVRNLLQARCQAESELDEKIKGITPPKCPLALLTFLVSAGFFEQEILCKRYAGARLYLARPYVLSYFVGSTMRDAATTSIRQTEGFDILQNSLRTIFPMSSASAAESNVLRGLLETHLERAFAANCSIPGTPCPDEGVNTVEVFNRALAAGVDFSVLGNDTESIAKLANFAIPEISKVHVMQDLHKNYIVVIPTQSVRIAGVERVGWWRLNPQDGSTLGMMDNGRGMAATEKAIVDKNNAFAWSGAAIVCFLAGHGKEVGESVAVALTCIVAAIFGYMGAGLTGPEWFLGGFMQVFAGVSMWIVPNFQTGRWP